MTIDRYALHVSTRQPSMPLTRRPPKVQRPGQIVLMERLAATTAARPIEPEAKQTPAALVLRSVEQMMTTKGSVSRSFLKYRELLL